MREAKKYEEVDQVIVVEEDNDDFRKVAGVLPNKIGPDGMPLKRNESDFMNNLFVNLVVRSFTDAEKQIGQTNVNQQKEQRKDANMMNELKQLWKKMIMERVLSIHSRFDETVKDNF